MSFVSTSILVNLLYGYIGSCAFIGALYTLFSKEPVLKPGASGLLKVLLFLCVSVVVEVLTVVLSMFEAESFKIVINSQVVLDAASLNIILYSAFGISLASFIIGWFGLFYVYYKAHIRIFHLSESVKLYHLSPFRWVRRFKKREYELEPKPRVIKDQLMALSPNLSEEEKNEIAKGYSFLFTGDDEIRIMNTVFGLIIEGLKADETVNYVCTNRHPIQIWNKLEVFAKGLNSQMNERIKNDFILIDAYTPNFGFDDEINEKKLEDLKREGVKLVIGKTIPGIHSATKQAFNLTKQKEKMKDRGIRRPNIMIYDSLSTMCHVSSVAGLQTFLHHMIPAEKNYQMWTFIIEYSDCERKLFRTAKTLVDSVFEFNLNKKEAPPEVKKLRIHGRIANSEV